MADEVDIFSARAQLEWLLRRTAQEVDRVQQARDDPGDARALLDTLFGSVDSDQTGAGSYDDTCRRAALTWWWLTQSGLVGPGVDEGFAYFVMSQLLRRRGLEWDYQSRLADEERAIDFLAAVANSIRAGEGDPWKLPLIEWVCTHAVMRIGE